MEIINTLQIGLYSDRLIAMRKFSTKDLSRVLREQLVANDPHDITESLAAILAERFPTGEYDQREYPSYSPTVGDLILVIYDTQYFDINAAIRAAEGIECMC